MNISMHHNLQNGCQLDITIHQRNGKKGHEIQIIGSKGNSLYKQILPMTYFKQFTCPYCKIDYFNDETNNEQTVFEIVSDDGKNEYRITVIFYTMTGDILLNVLEDSFEFNLSED